jgi:hypothetical protein
MIRTRTILFKPKAPNDMKNGDLSAKSWIIADPGSSHPWPAPCEIAL